MEQRLLLIETSATMRYVASTFLEKTGFALELAESFELANACLERQFEHGSEPLQCVLLSWPAAPDPAVQPVLEQLDGPDFHDLPVVVLSQEMPAQARAWVAAREHTVLANWREYKGLPELLARLLGDGEETEAAAPSKFRNADIAVLVVDDSPSIRYALSDLLSLNGYRVGVVASAAEALAAVERQRFDVAIIDYYLDGETGDAVCRQLLAHPAGTELACAVLTGNYADHIIQSSLRAGAIECMFKNEPSELLLARVDALSRLVRGRSERLANRRAFLNLVDGLAQAMIGVDAAGEIFHANPAAARLLDAERSEALVGQSLERLSARLAPEAREAVVTAAAAGEGLPPRRGAFNTLAGEALAVRYSGQGFGAGDGVLLVLEPDQTPGAAVRPPVAAAAEIEFDYLLIAVVFRVRPEGAWRSVALNEKLVKLVAQRLAQRVIQVDRMHYLGGGVYGVIIAQKGRASALLAARELASMVRELGAGLGKIDIGVHCSLSQVDAPHLPEGAAVAAQRESLQRARSAGVDTLWLVDEARAVPLHGAVASRA